MRQRKGVAADEEAATDSRVAKSSIKSMPFYIIDRSSKSRMGIRTCHKFSSPKGSITETQDKDPLINSCRGREVGISARALPATDVMVEYEGKMHKILSRGIRDPKGRVKGHRVEIRPAGSATKIWVGTFSTREKAKRAYDVALYITGKDAYYYKYPRNYFPQREPTTKPQYVKDMAKEYAEKTEKFPVNPLSLSMGRASLLPETAANSPHSPEDSLVTTQAAESPNEILKGDIEEPLASSDKSPESLSWQPYEMDQNTTQSAVSFTSCLAEDIRSFLFNDDYEVDDIFMAKVLETPPTVSPPTSSEECEFDKFAKSLYGSEDIYRKSTAIIDQGLIESQPQLNLFNPIEDIEFYPPLYAFQDQKRMRTTCDTDVEQFSFSSSSSSMDNLFCFPSTVPVPEGDRSIYGYEWL